MSTDSESTAPRDGDLIAPEVKSLSFAQTIALCNGGQDLVELDAALSEIIATLEQLHQDEGIRKSKASLSLKIDIARDDGVYSVRLVPTVKVPKAPLPASVFWATKDNKFTPENPRQLKMFGDQRARRTIVPN